MEKISFNKAEIMADSILNPKFRGKLKQKLDELDSYEALIEAALNLIGMESRRINFSKTEKQAALKKIITTLKKWEKNDKSTAQKTIDNFLKDLKQVGFGKSMVAKIAENVEKKLDEKNLIESFILALKHEIENNVYYKMVDQGMSKFGNDSATGLRFVRHFDFVQVSSNPVIATRAYEEFPKLWNSFKEIVKANPQWLKNPEKHADEITIYATVNSLLPNLLVFRPLALLSDFNDGLVSYQLNPFLAEDAEASVKDAEKIYSILRKILYQYDELLGWDPEIYKGRPNIVFKVAASSPAAIEITLALNSRGIGTNNTVTYSVSQELTLLIAEVEGMAIAIKKGIPITQAYQTNMIGRLADHLRDINEGCSKELAEAIKYSGIYVTRKVYKLFFSPENIKKWQTYIEKKFNLPNSLISLTREIFDKIDMLPASKRKADDTYQVLGAPNVTNTEFPTHQLKVLEESLKHGFDLEKYKDSIRSEPDPKILQKLLQIEDFRKAYLLTPCLIKKLKQVGIKDDFTEGGMRRWEWSEFGAVIKTMTEFKNAYLDFKNKTLGVISELFYIFS